MKKFYALVLIVGAFEACGNAKTDPSVCGPASKYTKSAAFTGGVSFLNGNIEQTSGCALDAAAGSCAESEASKGACISAQELVFCDADKKLRYVSCPSLAKAYTCESTIEGLDCVTK
jgi:hypothetical protein